jgi:hypothetical protein
MLKLYLKAARALALAERFMAYQEERLYYTILEVGFSYSDFQEWFEYDHWRWELAKSYIYTSNQLWKSLMRKEGGRIIGRPYRK